MDTVFDKNWFAREQHRLLWLLNHSTYFRRDLGIQECDLPHNIDITEITPNSFSWGDRYFEKDGEWFLERTTDFRGTDKFAHRMYYAFYPIWNIAHKFDLSLANKYAPSLNLGFDTLTAYPQEGNGGANITCDGFMAEVQNVTPVSWGTLVGAAGNTIVLTAASGKLWNFITGTDANTFKRINRSGFTFDTHEITSAATISAAILSLYGTAEANPFQETLASNIYSFAPANQADFVAGDYDSLGTTPYSSNKTLADWSIIGYNDFTLNSTGITAISKTGITNMGVREVVCDVANSAPTLASWGVNQDGYESAYFADQTGTNQDPKLVVTYTAAVGPANLKSYNTNLKANIKTICTNAIANTKTLNTNS